MKTAGHALFLAMVWTGVIVFIGIPVGRVIVAITVDLFSTVAK